MSNILKGEVIMEIDYEKEYPEYEKLRKEKINLLVTMQQENISTDEKVNLICKYLAVEEYFKLEEKKVFYDLENRMYEEVRRKKK